MQLKMQKYQQIMVFNQQTIIKKQYAKNNSTSSYTVLAIQQKQRI